MKTLFMLASILLLSCFSQAQIFIKVAVKANKVLYDSKHNLLYATVSSQDSLHGNQLVAINPATGQIVNTLFVGSEPTAMVLTSDKNHLFIALDGAPIVKRIELNQFKIEYQITLGADSFFGNYFPYDLATIKNNNNIVIVSRKWVGTSPSNAGIAVYKNQQKLSHETNYTDYSFDIELDLKNGKLYGYDSQTTGSGLTSYTVDTTQGISKINSSAMGLGGNIKYANGYLFSHSGVVVDLSFSTPLQIGMFVYNTSVWGSAFAVDDSAKNYYISQTANSKDVTVASFDVATFLKKKEITLKNTVQNNNMQVVGMEAIGTDNYAIIVKDTYNATFGNPAANYIILSENQAAGISENAISENIQIYPNPVTAYLTIDIDGPIPGKDIKNRIIHITDIAGKDITKEYMGQKTTITISMEEFNAGIYFVIIESNSGLIVKKIIKN